MTPSSSMLTARGRASRPPLTVERIEDDAGFELLRPEWETLLRESSPNGFFLTWEWLHTWWKHLAEGRSLCLMTVRDAGRLLAIAPLALRRDRLFGVVGSPCLHFLGTGSAGSDHLDLIVRRGDESASIRALAQAVEALGLTIEMSHVMKGGSSAAALLETLTGGGWASSRSTINVAPFIPLAGLTWPSYLGSLGREHRYSFERKLRRLQKQFDVSFDIARDEQQRREALNVLIALHINRWSPRGGSDAFHTSRLVSFHEEVTRLTLERGWLRLFVLRLDGSPVAALYGFSHGGRFYFYQSGFDPACARHGVGVVIMGLAIRSALEEGSREFDMLHGDERYKFHWAGHSRELVRMAAFPPSLRGRLHHGWVETRRTAGRLARRYVPGSRVSLGTATRPGPVAEGPHAA